jgi:hypothetical protein
MVVDELYRKLGHSEYAVGGGIGARGWDWDAGSVATLDERIRFSWTVSVPREVKTKGLHLDVLTQHPITPDPITNDYPTMLPMSIPKGYAIEELALQLAEELVLFPQGRYNNGCFEVLTQIVENAHKPPQAVYPPRPRIETPEQMDEFFAAIRRTERTPSPSPEPDEEPYVMRFNAYVSVEELLAKLDDVRSTGASRFPL